MALTLLMGLFAERTAEAQGTSGTVADPLSLRATSDLLTRYTEIRPEQRIVIEEAHVGSDGTAAAAALGSGTRRGHAAQTTQTAQCAAGAAAQQLAEAGGGRRAPRSCPI